MSLLFLISCYYQVASQFLEFKTTLSWEQIPEGPMPLTRSHCGGKKKLQTNRSLSAPNLTACEFWMAFFSHLSIPIFSFSRLWFLLSLWSLLWEGREASFLSTAPSLWALLFGISCHCEWRSHPQLFSMAVFCLACVCWTPGPRLVSVTMMNETSLPVKVLLTAGL